MHFDLSTLPTRQDRPKRPQDRPKSRQARSKRRQDRSKRYLNRLSGSQGPICQLIICYIMYEARISFRNPFCSVYLCANGKPTTDNERKSPNCARTVWGKVERESLAWTPLTPSGSGRPTTSSCYRCHYRYRYRLRWATEEHFRMISTGSKICMDKHKGVFSYKM